MDNEPKLQTIPETLGQYGYNGDDYLKNQKPKIIVLEYLHNEKVEPHFHNLIEFVFVESGFAMHSFNGRTTLLQPGDLYAINLDNYHSYFSVNNFKVYNVLFSLDEFYELSEELLELPGMEFLLCNDVFPLIKVDIADRCELILHLEKMKWERINKNAGWGIALKSHLIQFLLMYSRFSQNSKANELHNEYLHYIYKSVSFIEKNYAKDISPDDVAKHTGINRDYLSKQFKSKLDVSLAEYIRRLRIAKSLELITFTNKSIDSITVECGFGNRSVFSRTFKQIMGNSPAYYRNIQHNDFKKQTEIYDKYATDYSVALGDWEYYSPDSTWAISLREFGGYLMIGDIDLSQYDALTITYMTDAEIAVFEEGGNKTQFTLSSGGPSQNTDGSQSSNTVIGKVDVRRSASNWQKTTVEIKFNSDYKGKIYFTLNSINGHGTLVSRLEFSGSAANEPTTFTVTFNANGGRQIRKPV